MGLWRRRERVIVPTAKWQELKAAALKIHFGAFSTCDPARDPHADIYQRKWTTLNNEVKNQQVQEKVNKTLLSAAAKPVPRSTTRKGCASESAEENSHVGLWRRRKRVIVATAKWQAVRKGCACEAAEENSAQSVCVCVCEAAEENSHVDLIYGEDANVS